jgi:predicted DCC family thiol-disulfide oxidoreductase YuxK
VIPSPGKINIKEKSIVLFDGGCNFCNASVNFIFRNNKARNFLFVPLQSQYGKKLLKTSGLPEDYSESMVLIEDKQFFLKSDAALRIAKKLDGLWSWGYAFIFLPTSFRDAVYNWIARHRNSWFKNQNNCIVPDESMKNLFREE